MAVKTLHVCDFCGKTEDQVAAIVAGEGASICDECIALSVQVVRKQQGETLPLGWPDHKHHAPLHESQNLNCTATEAAAASEHRDAPSLKHELFDTELLAALLAEFKAVRRLLEQSQLVPLRVEVGT